MREEKMVYVSLVVSAFEEPGVRIDVDHVVSRERVFNIWKNS